MRKLTAKHLKNNTGESLKVVSKVPLRSLRDHGKISRIQLGQPNQNLIMQKKR